MKIPLTERRQAGKKRTLVARSFLLILIIFFSLFVGYQFGTSTIYTENRIIPCRPTTTAADADSTAAPVEPPDDSVNPNSEYFALLEKNHLIFKGQRLALIFSRTDTGKALAQSMTLIEFKPSTDSPEGKRVNDQLTFLTGQPQETFAEIQKGFVNFDGEFNNERQFLIQYVGRLDIKMGDKLDFLTKELLKGYDSTENKYYKMNSAIALATLMKLDVDQNTIEGILKQALKLNPPYTARLGLVSIYSSKYPDQLQRIETDFGL